MDINDLALNFAAARTDRNSVAYARARGALYAHLLELDWTPGPRIVRRPHPGDLAEALRAGRRGIL